MQSFADRMPLLTATSAFGLGRRRWSSAQQCYLHRLRRPDITRNTRRSHTRASSFVSGPWENPLDDGGVRACRVVAAAAAATSCRRALAAAGAAATTNAVNCSGVTRVIEGRLPPPRCYVGLVAVSVQEQAEDILVPPLLRNCLTLNYISFFPSHYLPSRTVVLAIVFTV